MKNFSPAKLQRLRFERGFSRESLASAAGVHCWSIQAWELGRHVPRGISIAAVARALGVEYEDLLVEEQRPAARKGSRSRQGGSHARGSAAKRGRHANR